MAALGPFGACKRVAVAVSGGSDSMALAVLLAGWGQPTALVVDHGLRPESGHEAAATASRLAALGVAARVLPINLTFGPALAVRARAARYLAMGEACRSAGLTDLLVAHHAQDQAETLLLRRRAGSGPSKTAARKSASTPAEALRYPLTEVQESFELMQRRNLAKGATFEENLQLVYLSQGFRRVVDARGIEWLVKQ